jgi:hypothetical protein
VPGLSTWAHYRREWFHARPHGRSGVDRHPGSRRDGVCRGVRVAGHPRAVRDHAAARRLRAFRTESDHGARAGFDAGGRDRRPDPAHGRGQPGARDCPGRHAGIALGPVCPVDRAGPPGPRRRSDLQTDPHRIPQRRRTDRAGRAIAQGLRLLRGGTGPAHPHAAPAARHCPRPHPANGAGDRRQLPGGHPAAEVPAPAVAGHPGRGAGSHRRVSLFRSGTHGATGSRGPAAAGPCPSSSGLRCRWPMPSTCCPVPR